MYGLKQAEVLANLNLEKLLLADGYVKTTHTPGLWKHKTRPIIFTLCVDDFGVQYVGQEHANHLITTLKNHFESLTVDWKGEKYFGLNINRDYINRTCDISMKGYVLQHLEKLNHIQSNKKNLPSKFTPSKYGQKIQMATK